MIGAPYSPWPKKYIIKVETPAVNKTTEGGILVVRGTKTVAPKQIANNSSPKKVFFKFAKKNYPLFLSA